MVFPGLDSCPLFSGGGPIRNIGVARPLTGRICSVTRTSAPPVWCKPTALLRHCSLRECLLLYALREQRGLLGVMGRGSDILSLLRKLEGKALFPQGFPVLWRCFPYDVVGQLTMFCIKTLHAEFPDDPRPGAPVGVITSEVESKRTWCLSPTSST